MTEFDAILEARQAIAGKIVRTPVGQAPGGRFHSHLAGLELAFKLEMLQETGSFKLRGVLNKLAHLSADERARGVLGMSSGNHAQALAYAAALEGLPATVIMPSYSVADKIEATKGYGAHVEIVEATELFEAYERARQERGLTAVHPFDDPLIVAGAGTAGLEMLEDVPEADLFLASIGGGGWISGVATAVKARRPQARVIGVEPEGAAAVRQSLDAGQPVRLEKVSTIADGLAAPFTGEVVLDRIRRFVDDVVTVSDVEIVEAMRLLVKQLRVIVEPSAAACFAALLSGRTGAPSGSTVAVMLSGGNVGAERLKTLL